MVVFDLLRGVGVGGFLGFDIFQVEDEAMWRAMVLGVFRFHGGLDDLEGLAIWELPPKSFLTFLRLSSFFPVLRYVISSPVA